MMLNDLDTSVFVEENELGDESPSLYTAANITCTYLQAYFHNHDATCEIFENQW